MPTPADRHDLSPWGREVLAELDQLMRAPSENAWWNVPASQIDAIADARGEDRVATLTAACGESMRVEEFRKDAAILVVSARRENLTGRRTRASHSVDKLRKGFETEILVAVVAALETMLPEPQSTPPPEPEQRPEPASSAMPSWFWPAALAVAAGWLVVVGLVTLLGGDPEPEPTFGLGDIDVTLHCVADLGPGATAHAIEDGSNQWECRGDGGTPVQPADLDAACELQYGLGAEARLTNPTDDAGGWECADLVVPPDGADCAIDPGGFNPSLGNEFSLYAQPVRSAVAEAEAAGIDIGCPTNQLHRWGDGVLQDFSGDAGIAALDRDTVVLLTGSPWLAFDRIKGINGEFVGYPISGVAQEPDGHWASKLSGGGAIVSGTEDGQYYWIPPVTYPLWVNTYGGLAGCLGAPISDPYTSSEGFRADFENGRMLLPVTGGRLEVTGDDC